MGTLTRIRGTTNDRNLGVIRIALGILFILTGAMKLLVPMLWNAWSGQLIAANRPFYKFNRWFVPCAELFTGLLLIAGFFSRIAALVVFVMMVVAAYVHIVADDPSLFPLQPQAPVIPIGVIALAGYIVLRGGGRWSKDLSSVIAASGR